MAKIFGIVTANSLTGPRKPRLGDAYGGTMRCSPLECATVTLLVVAGCSGYPTEALTFTFTPM